MKKHIPNMLTLLNLLCGCLAIISTFHKSFELTAILLMMAAVFDFFDGFAARLLGVHSELGKQLDSLADMVTFGVVPGFVMYQLIIYAIGSGAAYLGPDEPVWYLAYAGMLIPLFSAYRLAKEIFLPQTRIFEIIKANRRITADTALLLAKFFGTSAKFWLGIQDDYDLEEERNQKNQEFNNIKPVKGNYA
jgi:addiction module HigA family antidote